MFVLFIQPGVFDSLSVTPDTLRVLIIFAFMYAAYLDYKTRRVYNEFWIPLLGLCFVVLGWEISLVAIEGSVGRTDYLFSLAMSVLIAPSIAYTLWQQGILGGADLRAIVFLAVFFPQIPEITVRGSTYPLVDGVTPIFAITVLVNALILTTVYRGVLMLRNLRNGSVSANMTRATVYETRGIHTKHGDLIEGVESESPNGVDLDIIRMYLRWRGVPFHELKSNAIFYESSLPVIENDVGDGAVPNAAQTPLGRAPAEFRAPTVDRGPSIVPLGRVRDDPDDAWAAERFISHLKENGKPNAPTPADLRGALDAITQKERVWVSPAVPFFIPLTAGLLIALTYGSLFVGVTEWIAQLIISVLL